MADINSQVALGVNAPDPNQGLNTLSKILSLGQQGLAIQGQKSHNISLAADAAIGQQNAKEKMAGAQLLSDPVGNGLVDSDGNPTKDAQTKIMAAMPTTGADHYQGILNGAKSKIEFNRAANGLQSDLRNEVAGVVSGVAADPNASQEDAKAQLDAYVESKKGTPSYDNVKKIADTASTISGHLQDQQDKTGQLVPPGKEAWRNGYLTTGRTALGAPSVVGASGIGAPTAGVQNLGATNQPIVQAPALAGGAVTKAPGVTQNTIPPGYQMLNGQLVKIDSSGVSLPNVKQPPSPPPPAGGLQPLPKPALNAPKADQDRYLAQTAASTQHVSDVAAAANDPQNGTQVSRYRNKQILNILNTGDAQTGPNKELLNHIESSLTGGQSGTPYQTIGHYLAQNSAAVAAKMGVPNTNMGSEQAAASAGNVKQNPDAIKEITKVNDGINTALDLYNKGLSKATNNGANTDKVPAFRQAFGQNFDMNLFRYEDAVRNGDKGEIDKISKSLGPQGMQALGAKRKVIQSLANTGDLPSG
jgi:hypothetical protein